MSRVVAPQEILAKSRALCARQERCRSELHARLVSWGVDERGIQHLLGRLEKEDFLNEKRFAEHYAVSKFRQKDWGRAKIRHALQQMGLGAADIRSGLNELDEQEYRTKLATLVKKCWAREKGHPERIRELRVVRYLSSRGFEADLVRVALRG